MKSKTGLFVFIAIFFVAVFLIVVLPFFLLRKPAPDGTREPGKSQKTPDAQLESGIFRSDDGGKTWQARSWIEGQSGSIAALKVNRLIPDPVDPKTLYLATDGGGLWVSRSRGDLWAGVTDLNGVLDPTANVLSLAVNPDNKNEWYVAVFQKNRGRVLRTADGGRTFKEVYFLPLERFGVFDVYYDRAGRAVVIVTGQGGLLESTDQGRRWRVVRWFSEGLIRILVNPLDTSVHFVVTPAGSVFRTEDRGGTWADITPAFREFLGSASNQRWLVDQTGTLYLGSNYGLLRSRSNGTTFGATGLIIPPDALPVLAVAVDPRDASHIAVSADNQIYRSSDGGTTWEILTPPSSKQIIQLMIDPKSSDSIYAVAD